ncbi:MAG: peptidoglycan DD-metalloendopeptidase family protein [Zoogloeaceae bacterium]|jgi:lipoprotein NlpD|nr:peptidoglycan DD-metalloendopeptidase family protein [Zoogloeaceae bacterium]
MNKTLGWISLVCAAVIAAGCASVAPVPVEDRSQSLPGMASPEAYHTVKPGETLYRIALEYGQSYRDVAQWNNIPEPYTLSIGQVLRIAPPGAVVTTAETATSTPVTDAGGVETQALSSAPLKTQPMVAKQVYSDAEYARLTEGDAATLAPASAAATTDNAAPAGSAGGGTATVSGITWAWPATGKTEANFAQTKGVDIAGKAGDPVLAAADGTVVYAGSGLRGYGQLVIIKHNATFLSAYAHNRKILVKEKQAVKRGQKIAEMGNTDATAVKLHFEVRKQGKPVEPLDYLPKR